MTDKEKLQKIKELIEDTHSEHGYYSCRPYLSKTFKDTLLKVIEE